MTNEFNDLDVKAYTIKDYDDTILSITISQRATIYVPKTLLEKAIKKAMKHKEEIIV